MSSHNITSLPEEDYLGIIDLQNRFVGCKNWTDLNACLLQYFLPLVACESMCIVWATHELPAKGSVIDIQKGRTVGTLTVEDLAMITKLQSYHESLIKILLGSTRAVVACDVDVPRKVMYKEAKLYRRAYPEYQCPPNALLYNRETGKAMASYMVSIDRFESGWGFAVHRWYPNDKLFTLRDVRVMELIRLPLFQTIKTIVLSEELAKYQSLVESLADVPTGIALLRKDMSIVFANKSFRESIPLEPGYKLPQYLATNLQKEIDRQTKKPMIILPEIHFYKLLNGTFRLGVDQVNRSDGDEYWLLRLKPVEDSFSQINLRMEHLSNREKEICYLLKDGFGNKQIANRLFLSPHTIKTHMKNIYKKMEVQKRSKLVALMYKT